jgi:tetratricopeptide (TPR) repeat protein
MMSVFRMLGVAAGSIQTVRIDLSALSLSLILVIASLLLTGRSSGHGAYHDVVAALETKLKSNPDDAALRYKLAVAHAGHDEWQACLKEVDLVESLTPGRYPTGYLRGLSLHVGGKEQEAKDALDVFLAKSPEHSKALATRGRVLLKLALPEAAVADFENALKHASPPDSELVTDLAVTYKGLDRAKDASRVIDENLDKTGNTTDLLLCALRIETDSALWDSALGRIDALQKSAPRPEPWMARRAELLQTAGRPGESRAAWTALRAHLLSLPNLERGTPLLGGILAQSEKALGNESQSPVIASPQP